MDAVDLDDIDESKEEEKLLIKIESFEERK